MKTGIMHCILPALELPVTNLFCISPDSAQTLPVAEFVRIRAMVRPNS